MRTALAEMQATMLILLVNPVDMERKKHLEELDDEQLERKFRDTQHCILSSKTEEQVDKYTEQMKYAKLLMDQRKGILQAFTSMGKQFIQSS